MTTYREISLKLNGILQNFQQELSYCELPHIYSGRVEIFEKS